MKIHVAAVSCLAATSIVMTLGWRHSVAVRRRLQKVATDQSEKMNSLKGFKDGLETENAALKQDVKDRDITVSTLKRLVEKLEAQLKEGNLQKSKVKAEALRIRNKNDNQRWWISGANKKLTELKIEFHSLKERFRTQDLQQKAERAKYAALQGARECSMCLDTAATHAILPCGHHCVCRSCVVMLKDEKLCPVCRAEMNDFVRIF